VPTVAELIEDLQNRDPNDVIVYNFYRVQDFGIDPKDAHLVNQIQWEFAESDTFQEILESKGIDIPKDDDEDWD
jgi:hypothetical protein